MLATMYLLISWISSPLPETMNSMNKTTWSILTDVWQNLKINNGGMFQSRKRNSTIGLMSLFARSKNSVTARNLSLQNFTEYRRVCALSLLRIRRKWIVWGREMCRRSQILLSIIKIWSAAPSNKNKCQV